LLFVENQLARTFNGSRIDDWIVAERHNVVTKWEIKGIILGRIILIQSMEGTWKSFKGLTAITAH